MAALAEIQLPERIWRTDVTSKKENGLNRNPRYAWYLSLKATSEFAFALILLVVVSPLVAIAALLVKLTSRGPAFYTQIRLGQYGEPFKILKLRSMSHNCEKLSGPQWSSSGDSRVTPLGRLLRRSHIDELPQLWNVLRGDMSLIGPRPERPEFVPQLERALPHYRARLQVRPGITGLAQVQLPPDSDLSSVRRKLAYDLFYVRQMSPLLDLQILACTALKVLGVPFNLLSLLLWVPQNSEVENAAYGETKPRLRPVPQMQPAM